MILAPPFLQMPLVPIICPHCEKSVEVHVTDVARSRSCPSCGQALMLQVAERATGVKRKALLVGELAPNLASQDAFTQRQFEGEAFDRMRADPEVARASRRLSLGIAAVMSLILLVTVCSVFTHWGARAQAATAATPAEPAIEVKAAVQKPQHLPPMLSRPLDFEKIVKERKSELARHTDSSSGE
ncbi:hypothetical protein [Prosthecobacter dejongeii]|uniref:Uncharacterized protein n=1 Tax=Prosthecobacter dejongeii TaxID=48465 RepID=A0A7W7YMP0_9BACT|nr:hypothetical protein [Prosthecobacter dejongeii]MBB5038857.1 hypothetical protein [Prosthecobacter dejongeii]